jgi:Cytochrome C and Quinol oxidase polypeptide I
MSQQLSDKPSPEKVGVTLWLERWFNSSNAKDIGTLYLIFALFSGLIGTAFSVLIRLELSSSGVQFIQDNQLYNSMITAHAIVMIFFMVKTNANMLNLKPNTYSTKPNNIKGLDCWDIKINSNTDYSNNNSIDKKL